MLPQPRFRIYTTPTRYAFVLQNFFKNNLSLSKKLDEQLELKICNLLDTKNAVFMPLARTAIYEAIKHSIKPGQKVLLSPITIVKVVNMVVCAGGRPQFIDVEPNTCNIDANEIEKYLENSKQEEIGAVFVTHLHGLACDIEKIKIICEKFGLPLIEDAAQAFSTKVNNKWVGSFGDAGIFSFGLYKIVNAFYGGMLVTNSNKLASTVRKDKEEWPVFSLKKYLNKVFFALATDLSTSFPIFQAFTYWVFRFAYLNNLKKINDIVTVDVNPKRFDQMPSNYLVKPMPLQAKLIIRQLDMVEANNLKRISAAKQYYEGLKDIKEIIHPPMRTDGSHIYTYYAIRVPDRDALMRFSLKNNRDFVLSHYHNCAALACFKEFEANCKNAESTAKQLIYLPTYPRYSDKQIAENIKVIRRFFMS